MKTIGPHKECLGTYRCITVVFPVVSSPFLGRSPRARFPLTRAHALVENGPEDFDPKTGKTQRGRHNGEDTTGTGSVLEQCKAERCRKCS